MVIYQLHYPPLNNLGIFCLFLSFFVFFCLFLKCAIKPPYGVRDDA